MQNQIYIIVESKDKIKQLTNIIDYISTTHQIHCKVHLLSEILEYKPKDRLYLLYLNDNDIKNFFLHNINSDIKVGILPNDDCPMCIKNYGISTNLFEAVDDIFNEKLLSKIDLLKCNELITFNSITIGDMHGMNRIDYYKYSKLEKIKIFFRNLKNIKFKSYTITTSKEHSIQTAASGITILEHTIVNEKSTISEYLSIHDGKLNAFVLAPTSLISYIWYLISIFFYQKISLLSMPKSLGFIKSSKLDIVSSTPMDYSLDGVGLSAKEINLVVLKDSINIYLGRKLEKYVRNSANSEDEKDTVKVSSLPKAEVSNILIDDKLPLFAKASDDEFKDLFTSLRDSAKFSYTYLTLMILSTLLATTGLFANSAPVIIGAMILAPLMAPIISLSMGVIRADKFIIKQSIKTLAIGISMALLFSCFFSFLIPLDNITNEMQSRLSPNLLDLMVAILSGIAGAYANSKENISKSLAGVAIAVALVPPLSVTGIGIGLGDINIIYGSFLLFITNLVGITLSAALTFIVLGYSPVKRAKKGILYTSIMMFIIAIPLVLSFMSMVEKNNYFNQLKSISEINIDDRNIKLNILDINIKNEEILINMETISSQTLSLKEMRYIKVKLEEVVNQNVVLNISSKILVR